MFPKQLEGEEFTFLKIFKIKKEEENESIQKV